MKQEFLVESVRDSMGCYWAYTHKQDGEMVCCGSADALILLFDMMLESLGTDHKGETKEACEKWVAEQST